MVEIEVGQFGYDAVFRQTPYVLSEEVDPGCEHRFHSPYPASLGDMVLECRLCGMRVGLGALVPASKATGGVAVRFVVPDSELPRPSYSITVGGVTGVNTSIPCELVEPADGPAPNLEVWTGPPPRRDAGKQGTWRERPPML